MEVAMSWLLIWKVGLVIAATVMVIHAAAVAVEAARDATLLWVASRAYQDGNEDR
jgi:hypothetical protein